MTPAELRSLCDSLNDVHGTGGQTRLARLLGWHHSTIWRKLNGASLITQSDELANTGALAKKSSALGVGEALTLPPFSDKRKGTPKT
jgi:hypothetical protein